MKEQRTDDLNRILHTATCDTFHSYINDLNEAPALEDYFSSYIANTGISMGQIIAGSHLSRSYGYSILNGTKEHPSRDALLSLCIGAKMDLDTTQHALLIAGLGQLYSKVPRDAAIMIHINQKDWNLVKINAFLDQEGLETIHSS